jgi:hypothetical protein
MENPKKARKAMSFILKAALKLQDGYQKICALAERSVRFQRFTRTLSSERGDVPGWVLVVLMTTGLVTAIWTIAAPRLTSILKNSLDSMNGIR